MKTAIQKLYYSITEVSKILGEEQHVLRYWEREFTQLKPQKNRAGNRVYTQRDLQILRLIKKLLRQERYTVAGAKDHLRSNGVLDEFEIMNDDGMLLEAGAEPDIPAGAVDVNERDEQVRMLVDELRSLAAEVRDRSGIGL